MYCNKCGKEVADNLKFCPNCGSKIEKTNTQETPQKPNDYYGQTSYGTNKSSRSMGFYMSVIFSVLVVIMLLQKWINTSVTSFFGSEGYSLFQMSKFASNLSNYDDGEASFWLTLISIVIIVMCAVCILCTIVYIWKGIKRDYDYKKWGIWGMLCAVILAAAVIVLSIIINIEIENETGGFVSKLIQLTSMPYCTLVFALLSGIFIKKA